MVNIDYRFIYTNKHRMADTTESIPLARELLLPVAPAPWKALLSNHIQQTINEASHARIEFQLATTNPNGLPRVRTLSHRSFWGDCINHSQPHTSPLYESDCPTFITGASSGKGVDIYASGLDNCRLETVSGGGAQVEILYWFREIQIQWRIRGRCWLMASEPEQQQGSSLLDQGAEFARQAVSAYMRAKSSQSETVKKNDQIEAAESHSADSEGILSQFWNEQIESYAASLKEEHRKGFEKAGFRVGIIMPEAVEHRDRSRNKVELWAIQPTANSKPVHRREWVEVKRWP